MLILRKLSSHSIPICQTGSQFPLPLLLATTKLPLTIWMKTQHIITVLPQMVNRVIQARLLQHLKKGLPTRSGLWYMAIPDCRPGMKMRSPGTVIMKTIWPFATA